MELVLVSQDYRIRTGRVCQARWASFRDIRQRSHAVNINIDLNDTSCLDSLEMESERSYG